VFFFKELAVFFDVIAVETVVQIPIKNSALENSVIGNCVFTFVVLKKIKKKNDGLVGARF
jgi:hypothetical protein